MAYGRLACAYATEYDSNRLERIHVGHILVTVKGAHPHQYLDIYLAQKNSDG